MLPVKVELHGLDASIERMIRGIESGASYTFSVTAHSQKFFGEFKTDYEADEKHYSIAIASLGYRDNDNVGNPSPGARKVFQAADIQVIEDVIMKLFTSEQEKPFPLSDAENFTGTVTFLKGWVRTDKPDDIFG